MKTADIDLMDTIYAITVNNRNSLGDLDGVYPAKVIRKGLSGLNKAQAKRDIKDYMEAEGLRPLISWGEDASVVVEIAEAPAGLERGDGRDPVRSRVIIRPHNVLGLWSEHVEAYDAKRERQDRRIAEQREAVAQADDLQRRLREHGFDVNVNPHPSRFSGPGAKFSIDQLESLADRLDEAANH